MQSTISRSIEYGVSSKYDFGTWNYVVYHFKTEEQANMWLNTEEYDFRQRELMSKTSAIKLAGRKLVKNAIEYSDTYEYMENMMW